MTAKIAVARVAASTSTGTQNITTTDLGGDTPGAVLFIFSKADTDATAEPDAILGFGAATSTSERWTCCSGSNDADADTNVGRCSATNWCIQICFASAGAVIDGEADFDGFIANGCTIDWSNAPGNALFITAIFIAWDDSSDAYAGTYTPGTSVDSAVDVTAPGFEPTLVICATVGDSFTDNGGSDYHDITFGVAVNDGSDTQRCISQRESNAQSAGSPEAMISENYVAGQLNSGAASFGWASEIGSFDSSGFSSTLRLGTAGTDKIGYLAVYLENGVAELATYTTPTSTGNDTIGSPSFTPLLTLLGMTQLAAVDTGATDASAGPIGMSVMTADAQYSTAIAIEDASTTTDTQSLADNQAVNLPDDDGTTGVQAVYSSMTELNYSAAPGAYKWFTLFVGQQTSSTIPLLYRNKMLRGGLGGMN